MGKKTGSVSAKKKNSNLAFENLSFALIEASKISFSLVFFPVTLLLLGVALDKRLETAPLFIILGIISGLVIGLFEATRVKNIQYINKRKLFK